LAKFYGVMCRIRDKIANALLLFVHRSMMPGVKGAHATFVKLRCTIFCERKINPTRAMGTDGHASVSCFAAH